MKSIAWHCLHCSRPNRHWVEEGKTGQPVVCTFCQESDYSIEDPDDPFEACPLCHCHQLYVQKDFNRGLGLLIVLGGIVLVPWTYGLSLPFFAGIDWLLYQRVASMVICYRCGGEFRGFPIPARLKPYLHKIGLRHDRTRLSNS